ncbi:hypothetical protein M5D96_009052 [Drosophila gunungcola]|uniref:Uncharacterized protein n=1 Tax=Drosophila gunungcola TaxID=103775 RepID=A0A9P9YJK9_9MUSC|nr:hypothetical protein M5D96_009052 [Drosophila gunungcola]
MEIIQISTNTRSSGIKTPQIAARSHPKDTQNCRECWISVEGLAIRWDSIRCLFVWFKCKIGGDGESCPLWLCHHRTLYIISNNIP